RAGGGDARGDSAEPAGAGGLSQDMSAADTPEPLVSVEDIHTYYGKSHILDGVSLRVGAGGGVGLLGGNGVGKSTTLKTIMGLVSPERGRIVFAGKSIEGVPAHRVGRRRGGFGSRGPGDFPPLPRLGNLRTAPDPPGGA